jgi:hypothetical protein
VTEFDLSLAQPNGDVFAPAAVEGLVGQTPMVLYAPGDMESVAGRATITAARLSDDGALELTLDVGPEGLSALDVSKHHGYGYFRMPSVRMMTVWPDHGPPAVRAP